jgi:hypothetical protein
MNKWSIVSCCAFGGETIVGRLRFRPFRQGVSAGECRYVERNSICDAEKVP